jgi:hypothetical protein
MKIGKRWPLYLLLIVVGVLGMRMAWRLSVSETGWTPHLEQWANVATSLVGVEHRKVSDRDPAEQATFWLNEVKKIGPANDDPELAMGAAWMLDAPQFGFISRHVRKKKGMDFPGLPASLRRELDDEAIAAMTEEFELLCRKECLANIERAVRLDDANVELRRARALLLFQTKFMSFDSEPRQDDWLSVLDECARVDPDNALYDYLAALHLWTSSANYGWDDDGYVLNVEDKDRFDEGNARLSAGLGKAHLRFGTAGEGAVFEFLDETSVSRSDYLNAAGSRQIDSRSTNLLLRIMRWESVQSDAEKRAGRFDAAVGAVRRVLAISEQVTEAGNYPSLLTSKLILRQWSFANLEGMHEKHPNLLSADEAASVSKQLAEVQRELHILGEVRRRMAVKASTSVSGATVERNLVFVFLMATAQILVILCVALALISSLISALFGRNGDGDQVTFGWVRQVVAWLLAVSISFILLGMVPAEIVSRSAQTWMVCGAIWIGFASVFLGLFYLFRRRFQLPVGQVAVLAIVTSLLVIAIVHTPKIIDLAIAATATLHPILSIALILLLALTCWAMFHFLWKFIKNQNLTRRRKLIAVGAVCLITLAAVPAGTALGIMTHNIDAQAWISPTVWEGAQDLHFEAKELQSAMKMDDSLWVWAFIQWQAYHGPLVAPIIAVVIAMVWHLIRRAGRVEGGLRQILRSQKRNELRRSGKSVAGSCLVAALMFLALYLGTTPPVADLLDTYDRVHLARIARPATQAWDEIAEITKEIRVDKETMARLQAEIDELNRELAKQEEQ